MMTEEGPTPESLTDSSRRQERENSALLRVAHLIYSPALGGSEMCAAEICARLDRSQYDPRVLFMYRAAGPMPGILATRCVECVSLGSTRVRRLLGPLLPAVALRRLRLDVLHVHHVPLWIRIRRAAKWAGVRHIVLTEHAKFSISRSPLLQDACRRAAETVSCFTVVSENLKDYFVSDLGVPAERLRVVRNGVDTLRFCPGERSNALRGLLPGGYTGPVAITVGRLTEAKDHGNLLGAWSLLERQGRAPYLLIVGDGELRAEVERQVEALNLGERVGLVGARSDIDTLLRGTDIFLVSSRREGLPMALLEALASGVPAVATTVGGIPEVLRDGHNGILVPPESPEALAAAVRDLLADRPRRERLAAAGRSSVAEAWSLDRTAARYAEIYAECGSRAPS